MFRGGNANLLKRMTELEYKHEKLLKSIDVAIGEFCRISDANVKQMRDELNNKIDEDTNDLHNRIIEIRIDVRDIQRILRDEGHNGFLEKSQEKKCCIKPFKYGNLIKNASVIQKEREDFIQKLKNEGHKCITIKESYPIQVGWCGHDHCSSNGG